MHMRTSAGFGINSCLVEYLARGKFPTFPFIRVVPYL